MVWLAVFGLFYWGKEILIVLTTCIIWALRFSSIIIFRITDKILKSKCRSYVVIAARWVGKRRCCQRRRSTFVNRECLTNGHRKRVDEHIPMSCPRRAAYQMKEGFVAAPMYGCARVTLWIRQRWAKPDEDLAVAPNYGCAQVEVPHERPKSKAVRSSDQYMGEWRKFVH